jgi:hypothetical protein
MSASPGTRCGVLFGCWLLAAPVFAQDGRDHPPGGGRPFGPEIGFMGIRESFEGKVVKGAPYRADSLTEITQTLADGNRIVRKTTGTVARDSEGRTRREQALAAIGPLLPEGQAPRMAVISDPVAGSTYVLEIDRHVAHRLKPMSKPPGLDSEAPPGARRPGPSPATESLGTQTVAGVEADGTRNTVTIPPGEIGNEKAIVIVAERWYSPDLQVVVQSRRRDPRMGETTYRLTAITRGEPDHSLFEVPPGFTVVEGPPMHRFGKRSKPGDEP